MMDCWPDSEGCFRLIPFSYPSYNPRISKCNKLDSDALPQSHRAIGIRAGRETMCVTFTKFDRLAALERGYNPMPACVIYRCLSDSNAIRYSLHVHAVGGLAVCSFECRTNMSRLNLKLHIKLVMDETNMWECFSTVGSVVEFLCPKYADVCGGGADAQEPAIDTGDSAGSISLLASVCVKNKYWILVYCVISLILNV